MQILYALILLFSVFSTSLAAPSRKISGITSTTGGEIDLCMGCHDDDPGRPHERDVFGCYVCHRGNPLSGDMTTAHRGMIRNPGELDSVERSCGQSGCHVKQVDRVKGSLMATNRGIISTLRFYWGETNNHDENLTVHDLMLSGMNSPALDYYRKLCGTCHLWMHKGAFSGFLGEKGGGCSACHTEVNVNSRAGKLAKHPAMSRKVSIDNCVRCHNRSGRIALSYQGIYESEGYGTPFNAGELSDIYLRDGRFIHKKQGDLHYKAGMLCVDCHTQNEIMGDGGEHAHIEDQLEITCETCHGDKETPARIARMAKTEKPSEALPLISGLVATDGKIMLKGKNDGRMHTVKELNRKKCRNRLHARLSCQACHSPGVPQCYGCHVRADARGRQLDKLTMQRTAGSWQEFKSWMRYDTPVLGVAEAHVDRKGRKHSSEVLIIVPG